MLEDLRMIEENFGAFEAVTPLEALTNRYGEKAVEAALKTNLIELRSVMTSPTIYAVLTDQGRACL